MNLQIIIVEDEAVVAAHLASQVVRFGYRVIASVSTGEQAIEAVRRELPDLILMDVRLGGSLDGIETAERLRSEYEISIPILFLTAHSDEDTLKRASATSPLGYVLKPFDDRELHTQLQLAFYKSQVETEKQRAAELLREKEERLQLAMQVAGLGAWETDLATGQYLWDERIPALLGLSLENAAALSDRWADFIYPDDQTRVLQAFQSACERNEPFDSQFRVIHADGSVRWFASRGEVVAIHRRKRMVGIVQDITERKHSEAELRRWKEELEWRVEERTQALVASQSKLRALAAELNLAEQRERKRLAAELHDHLAQLLVLARIKLGQIRLVDNPLSESRTDELLREMDETLSESVTYTRTLVADLSPPILHEFGLSAALKWLVERMQHQHQLPVTFRPPAEDRLDLPEDKAVLIFQSVRELLINAAKHARCKLAVVETQLSPEALHIKVSDDGVGFDAASTPSISTGSVLSSHFGLFSIRERMEALGGIFNIASQPGSGTLATLTLPLSEGPSPSFDTFSHEVLAALPIQAPPPPLEKRQDGTAIRVLLVDDHAMMRQGLRSVLEGYSDVSVVGEASDGQEAVQAARELLPSIVVMDINMPKMNGIEATRRIKTINRDIVVIGLSVNAGPDTQDAMCGVGAWTVLTKEAAVEELYGTIKQALEYAEIGHFTKPDVVVPPGTGEPSPPLD